MVPCGPPVLLITLTILKMHIFGSTYQVINNPGHKILESHTNPTQVVWHRGHGESPCLVQQTCLRTSSDLSLNLVMSESNSLGRGFNTLPEGCVAMWRESGLAVDYRLTTGKSLGG